MSTNELLERVTVDPQVCHGKPCIRGLRYPVTSLRFTTARQASDDLLAALAYGARLSDAKRIALA